MVSTVDDISARKSRLQCILDVHKAATLFDKKRTRKDASAVSDKVLAMRGAGVTSDMVPACLASCGIYASVFIVAVDKKLKDAARYRSMCGIAFEIGEDVEEGERRKI